MQAQQAVKIVNEIEDIKSRLISLEMAFIESETPEQEDVEAVKEAMEEYSKGKTIPFNRMRSPSLKS